MIQRKIVQVHTPHAHQGFLGEGHVAKAIIDGNDFRRTDPFMLLMDDRLKLPGGTPAGRPHPHAGFETVTLVIKGDEKDWHTGSLELMTAGKGIIHSEEITSRTDLHILQLWLVLPPEKRWAEPFWQQIRLEDAPTLTTGGSAIRVYSGGSNGLTAPLRNHTPFTLVDFTLAGNAAAGQEIPARYNGFLYVLEGEVWAGATKVQARQSAWLDEADATGESEITFKAAEQGARFIFYAAAPHGAQVVSHGPFIADTREDIVRLYREYNSGKMPHLNSLPEENKVMYGG